MKLSELLSAPEKWLKFNAGNGANTFCLGSALQFLATGDITSFSVGGWNDRRMDRIVRRLFPERYDPTSGYLAIVQFNNHSKTRFEDIEKVIREWEREEEAGAPIL